MVVNKDGSSDHGETVSPEDVTRSPVEAPLGVAKKKKISTHERRTFLPKITRSLGRRREEEKKRVRGGKGRAGERGAYADDGESGVQRAHSLTLL